MLAFVANRGFRKWFKAESCSAKQRRLLDTKASTLNSIQCLAKSSFIIIFNSFTLN